MRDSQPYEPASGRLYCNPGIMSLDEWTEFKSTGIYSLRVWDCFHISERPYFHGKGVANIADHHQINLSAFCSIPVTQSSSVTHYNSEKSETHKTPQLHKHQGLCCYVKEINEFIHLKLDFVPKMLK